MVMLCIARVDRTRRSRHGRHVARSATSAITSSAQSPPRDGLALGIMSDSNDRSPASTSREHQHLDARERPVLARIVDTLVTSAASSNGRRHGRQVHQPVGRGCPSVEERLPHALMGQDEIDKRVASVTGTTVEKMNAASSSRSLPGVNNGQQAQLEKRSSQPQEDLADQGLARRSVGQPAALPGGMNLAKARPSRRRSRPRPCSSSPRQATARRARPEDEGSRPRRSSRASRGASCLRAAQGSEPRSARPAS